MVEAITLHGGWVICFNANNNLQMMTNMWAVVRYVRNNKINLIHAHLPWAGVLGRLVGRICGVPVIYTEHNMQERYHPITKFMNLTTMNMLTSVIAVSEDVANSIREHKRGLKINLQTILNGVNTERFKRRKIDGTQIREKIGIPSDALVVGTVAVFRTQKRLDIWMEQAAVILHQHPNVHFIIVGDGPLKEILSNKRIELELQGRLHMPGLEIEVRPFMSAFDIYMMSSIFEGLPLALLEAMSMQCPVIATEAGGVKEVIRNEIDGLLCAVSEPEQLAVLASRLIQNSDLRLQYGRSARERVVTAFNMENMVIQLENLYHSHLVS